MRVCEELIKKKAWRKFYYEHKAASKGCYTKPYTYKLRINLRAGDYSKHRDAILAYLTTLNASEYNDRFLGVLKSFKIPTDAKKEEWEQDRYMLNRKQFTLYLDRGVTYEGIRSFVDSLQAFLARLDVYAALYEPTDLPIVRCRNISMRLERFNGKSLHSNKLIANTALLDTYNQLQQDDTLVQRLCVDADVTSIRSKRFDHIHLLMSRGFRERFNGNHSYGSALFNLATSMRACQQARLANNADKVMEQISKLDRYLLQYIKTAHTLHYDTKDMLKRIRHCYHDALGESHGSEFLTLLLFKVSIVKDRNNPSVCHRCLPRLFRPKQTTKNNLQLNRNAMRDLADRIVTGLRPRTVRVAIR